MHKGRKRAGFTLIELAVVLAIVAVCVSLIALVVRPDERTAIALEAERLARLLELAALESRLTASPITWTSDGHGYRFLRHPAADRGVNTLEDATLRPRALPAGMTILRLHIESSPAPALRLDFAPNAPALAFVMEISLGAARATISGSPLGRVSVKAVNG